MAKQKIQLWESKREFKEEVYRLALKIKVKVKVVTLRPMTRKWASCSTTGYFTFNAELLGMDKSLGEYVILHELLHYHVPNHGKLWKTLMEAHMPDYEKRSDKLQKKTS